MRHTRHIKPLSFANCILELAVMASISFAAAFTVIRGGDEIEAIKYERSGKHINEKARQKYLDRITIGKLSKDKNPLFFSSRWLKLLTKYTNLMLTEKERAECRRESDRRLARHRKRNPQKPIETKAPSGWEDPLTERRNWRKQK